MKKKKQGSFRAAMKKYCALLMMAVLFSSVCSPVYAVSENGVTLSNAENLAVKTKAPTYGSNKIDINFTSGGWNVNGTTGAVAEAEVLMSEQMVDSCYDFHSAVNAAPFNGDMTLTTDTDGNKVISYTTGTGRDYFQNNTAYGKMVDGQAYTVSYRYKVVSLASDASKITLQTAGIEAGGSRDVTVAIIDGTTKKGTWIQVEHDFTYGGSAYSYWRLLQVSGGKSGDLIYFDDIQVSHIKTYEEPVYGGGKYTDAEGIVTLVSSTGGEFYRDSLVMTPGSTYKFSYEIKTGDCVVTPYLMDRTNGNTKTTLNEYKVAANTDWTTYTFEYTCDGTGKKTNADGYIVYRLGFARGSTGYVYTRRFELREVIWESEAVPNLKEPTLIPEDSDFYEKIVTVPQGGSMEVTVPNIREQKKYLLSFRARTVADADTISVSLGSAGLTGLVLEKQDGYASVSVSFTPQESGTVALTFGNSAITMYDSVLLHRVYEYGDITADDKVNVCDLVRYKRILSEEALAEPGTYIYADIDKDDAITAKDCRLLVQKLLGILSE